MRLKRKLAKVEQERDFLKEAVAYFAKESKCDVAVSTDTATNIRSASCADC
jgi:hypothetical protein